MARRISPDARGRIDYTQPFITFQRLGFVRFLSALPSTLLHIGSTDVDLGIS